MCTHYTVVGYDIFTFRHASQTRSEIGTRQDIRQNRRPAERSDPRNSVQPRRSAFHFFPFLPATLRNWLNSYKNKHKNENKQMTNTNTKTQTMPRQ